MTKRLVNPEVIVQRIFLIRGQRIMIDRDLAELYGVETKHLNRQVKRNHDRFPPEFMFQLTAEEKRELVTNCHQFKKPAQLEEKIGEHDGAINALFDAIKQLMAQPEPKEKKIGFVKESRARYRTA